MYYGYGMGYDPMYLLLIVISTVLGLATQSYIKSTYAKWSKVPLDSSATGADVARRMLSDEGLRTTSTPVTTCFTSRRETSTAAPLPVPRLPATRRAMPSSTRVATFP